LKNNFENRLNRKIKFERNLNYDKHYTEVVNNPKKYFRNPHALKLCELYKKQIIKSSAMMTERHYKRLYEGLMAGDTKGRTLRATMQDIIGDYLKREGLHDGGILTKE